MIYNVSLAYDLKLVVDKNANDVIKPSWIRDSIALGETVVFHRKFVSHAVFLSSLGVLILSRYFFHATREREDEVDYNEGGEEETMEEDTEVTGVDDNAETMRVKSRETSEQKEHDLEDLDPGLAEWFRGGERSLVSGDTPAGGAESGTETGSDNDSDNADVANEEEDEVIDEWEIVKGGERATDSEDVQDVKMGETDEAMAYDENLIFKHL
jgi:DNA ligase-4